MLSDSIIRRFWKYAKPNEHGYLEWTGAPSKGYGALHHTRTPTRTGLAAHRIAFELYHGYEPAGCVCHHCDRPLCVDKRCLFEASHAENMADMAMKGRASQGKEAPLTEGSVRAIRVLVRHTTQKEVAALFGRSKQNIQAIVARTRWAWVAP